MGKFHNITFFAFLRLVKKYGLLFSFLFFFSQSDFINNTEKSHLMSDFKNIPIPLFFLGVSQRKLVHPLPPIVRQN